jgi:TonB family protein
MLQHELTHIRQKHSLDKLILELVLIFCWMNPFFWLIRKELYMIHEFLADQNAIEKHNGTAFAEMILQSMHIHPTPVLANPFFTSQIKRRLYMITSSDKPKYSYIKRITTLLIGTTTVLLIACTTEKTGDMSAPAPVKVVEGFPLPEGFNRFSVKDINNPGLPEGTLIFLDGNPVTLAELKNIKPDLIEYDVLLDTESAIKKYGEKAKAGAYELYSFPIAADGGQPGKEDLPSFPGGKDGWRQYLQSNLRYPDSAIDKGTMGIVKIACTIMHDGTLGEAIIVENPGDGLGEEALRVLTNGPKWIPGKVDGNVTARRIVIPVTFRLE